MKKTTFEVMFAFSGARTVVVDAVDADEAWRVGLDKLQNEDFPVDDIDGTPFIQTQEEAQEVRDYWDWKRNRDSGGGAK